MFLLALVLGFIAGMTVAFVATDFNNPNISD